MNNKIKNKILLKQNFKLIKNKNNRNNLKIRSKIINKMKMKQMNQLILILMIKNLKT